MERKESDAQYKAEKHAANVLTTIAYIIHFLSLYSKRESQPKKGSTIIITKSRNSKKTWVERN